MKRRLKYKIGCVAFCTLLITTGCSSGQQQAFNDNVVSVEVSKVQKQLIASDTVYSGVIEANQIVSISPKMSGKVVELPVDVGEEVKAGDVLLKLDDRELQNALKQAEAAEAAASANVKNAQATVEKGVVSSESGVVQAKGNIEQAQISLIKAKDSVTQAQNAVTKAENAVKDNEIALENAKKVLENATVNYDRMKQLYEQNLISKADLEKSELSLQSAKTSYNSLTVANNNALATLENAKQALESAKESYEKTANSYKITTEGYNNAKKLADLSQNTASIEASEMALKQAQVSVQVAKDNLQDSVLTSPINGVIASLSTNVGERIAAQSPVIKIVDLSNVKVVTYIPATDINQIKVGGQVQVKILSTNTFAIGTVKTISPLDDNGKGYPVEVQVPNPDATLKPGMRVDLQFIEEGAEQVMVVPTTATFEEDGKSFVYVVQDDHPERKEITIKEKKGSMVVVSDGVSEGDLIITNNIPVLTTDTKISY